jgi:hypothetical protein
MAFRMPAITALLHLRRALAPRTLLILLAAAIAALFTPGCRMEAQDQNYHFNNPLDPDPDEEGNGEGTGQLIIAMVNTDPDVVVIVNEGPEDTEISNWTLENDNTPADKYTFSAFTLLSSGFVRVHSTSGTDSDTDLYSSTAPNWGPSSPNDVARLKNNSGITIFTCQIGNACWQ